MTKSSKLSVIIPNCGDGDTLPRAIRSVQRTAPTAEVLVIDNDGIDPAMLPSENLTPRIIRCENQPPGHNRNVGIARANGDYLLFCDADDELIPRGVEPRITAIQNGADIAVGDPVYIGSGDSRRDELGKPAPDPTTAYLLEKWVPVIGCPLCHRRVFETVTYPEYLDRAQDLAFWARAFAQFTIAYVNEPVYRYHQTARQRSRHGLARRYLSQSIGVGTLPFVAPEYTRPALRRALRAGWIGVREEIKKLQR